MSDDKPTAPEPLKYGDIIIMSSPFNDNCTLFSDGIVKSQIYLKDFGTGLRKKSFFKSLFQIFPAFVNTHKTQALAIRNGKGTLNGNPATKEKIEELKEKLTFEYRFNLEHFEKVKETPIAYDKSIQFLHLSSNKFLACRFEEAEVEKENYKLELVDVPTEESNFKITSSYRYQKDNEGLVYYKEQVFITCASNHLNKTPYLQCNYSQVETHPLSIKKTIDSERISQDSPPKRRVSNARSSHGTGMSINQNLRSEDNVNLDGENKSSKREINVSLSTTRSRWKFHCFAQEHQDKQFLSYGDIIWMNHAEYNAAMIARKEKNGEVDFVKTGMSDSIHQQSSGDTNGMWIIENQNQSQGGLIEWEDTFRLKHLSSGKYLSVDYSHLKKKHILKLDAEKNEDSLFKFEIMSTLMHEDSPQYYKNISKEAYIRIKSPVSKLWLHVDNIGDRMEGCLLSDYHDDDIFKLFRANSNEIWETAFLISCFPILQNYLVALEETSGKMAAIMDEQYAYHKIEKRAREAQECLIQLELFCTNRLLNTSSDQKYGEVNPKRQKVLREQYFLNTLGEILKFSFTESQIESYLTEKENQEELKSKKGFNLQKLARKAKIAAGKGNDFFLMEHKINICRLIYKLFKSICKENEENEKTAFSIIDQFQYHAKYLVEAVDCFISIINSNEQILSKIGEDIKTHEILEHIIQPVGSATGPKKKIKLFNLNLALGIKDPNDYESQNFIAYFLKLIYDSPLTRRNLSYLTFLKSICVCNGKGITTNQEHLYKIFMSCKPLDKAIFMETIVNEDNNIEIQLNDNIKVLLSDCYKLDNNATLWNHEMKYFLEQIAFYSTLLEGRNYLWKMRLEKQFPVGVVFEQIYNVNLSLELRSVFCDLALALYIDQEPLNPKIVPNLCRVFKKRRRETGSFSYASVDHTHKLAQIDKANFVKLLENVVNIVREQKAKIISELENNCENVTEAKAQLIKVNNFLNNIVLAKLVKLLCRMVTFDLFNLLDGRANYYQIVHDLLHILEFDKSNPSKSFAVMKLRDENYKKSQQIEGKLKVFNMIGDLAGMVGDISKGLVGSVFGGEKKKAKTEGEGIGPGEEGDDNQKTNHPIMKGMILLKNQLDQLNYDNQTEADNNEIMIKGEICDLFNHMLDLRQDYLISNLLGWYEDVVPKITDKPPSEIDTILKGVIEHEVGSIFPDIAKTGLAEIDLKYKPKEDNLVLGGLKRIVKNVQKTKQPPKLSKLLKYCEEEEFPDIDTLFTGLGVAGRKEVLPSLLMAFYLTNDTHLENKLLTLVTRMFGQRSEIVQNMENLEMVFERDDVEAYYKLEKWIEDLRLQTQRSEIWLSDYVQTRGEKDWELKNVMKLFKDITNLVFRASEENEKHGKSRQNMMKNLAAHKPMLGIIRDGAFHLKSALEDHEFPAEAKKNLIELFYLAHACLICFCHNNPINQKILAPDMKLFLSNLNIDIGQILLVCEVCMDNKEVCKSEGELIVNSLLEAIIKYGHKAAFLDPMTVLQKHKTGFQTDNHIKILNKFISASRALEENELQALYAAINPDNKEVELSFHKILPKDEPFKYHSKLFDILLFDCEGTDTLVFTHGRLRKIFTVSYCLRLLQHMNMPVGGGSVSSRPEIDIYLNMENTQRMAHRGSIVEFLPQHLQNKIDTIQSRTSRTVLDQPEDGFRLLKPKVILLLGTLYLKGDKNLAEEFEDHLDLFVEFVRFEKDQIQNLPEDFRPSREFISYLFGSLLVFIKEYVEKLILTNADEARDRRDSAAILELVDIVYSRFPTLAVRVNKEEAMVFKSLAKHYIDEANVTNPQVAYMLDMIVQSKENLHTKSDDPTPNVAQDTERKKYVFFESKEAASYSIYWRDFVHSAADSKSLNEAVKNERAALSESIWRFEEIFPKEYRKKYKIEITGNDLIKKMILFLQDGQKNKADESTMIATLRVLREIIDSAPDQAQMQSEFDNNGGTEMLLSVLSDTRISYINDELLLEFLEFGISLLDEGNQDVQKTIHNYCLAHTRSEIMFGKFASIISGQISYLQTKAELKSDPAKIIELEQIHGLKSIILEKLLRFLQLWTEGHYEDLQNYLRFQTNSRDKYNLVEAVIELLKTYSSDLVQENYENIIKCLDTLNEFVQGPCHDNQLALVDGKFFEIVLTLFNTKIKSAKSEQKRRQSKAAEAAKKSSHLLVAYSAAISGNTGPSNQLEGWMLTRLKYKVLILVNSLLEKSEKDVIKRVMRSLPLEVLKKSLMKIFKKYKELYGNKFIMESLKHFDGDPNDKDDPKPVGYYEMIIESGFMIYFLICSYTDIDSQDIDPDILNEINELKETKTSASLQDRFKSSVFGQLGTFGYTFIKSLLDTGNEMKKGFEKKFSKKRKQKVKENEEARRLRKSQEKKILNKEAMQFFGQNSSSIEVSRDNGVERIQFMVLPFCKELPREERKAFHETVDRQNPKTKIKGLVDESERLIDICKHELNLKIFFNKRKFIAIFTNFVNLWKDLAFLLSLLLNFLILTSYSSYFGEPDDENGGRMTDPELFLLGTFTTERTVKFFLACGTAMAFCSIFVVLFFLLKRAPLILKQAWHGPFLIKIGRVVFYSLQSLDIVYYIAYGVLAVLGTVIHPFFFAFHLTEILFRYPTLKNVIKSVWNPRRQLLLTFLLYFVLTYFFSLYAYAYLDDLYQGDCESTLMCLKSTYDGTFKANGGIGGWIKGRVAGEKFNTERFIYDNLANIILLIIMVNIVAGIIIDTFGSLRGDEEQKNEDIEQKCFICGLEKDEFDRQADTNYNFNYHITKEHNMWDYIFFIAFLLDKDETEYTGIESYIADKLKDNDTSWFPFNKALSLKNLEEADQENTKEAVDKFKIHKEEIDKSMKSLRESYATFSTKLNIK